MVIQVMMTDVMHVHVEHKRDVADRRRSRIHDCSLQHEHKKSCLMASQVSIPNYCLFSEAINCELAFCAF